MKDKQEQIELLLTRLGDRDLTLEERDQVRRVLESDRAMGDLAAQYKKLDRLLQAYRRTPTALDWDSYLRRVGERIEDELAFEASEQLDRANDAVAHRDEDARDEQGAGVAGSRAAREYRATEALLGEYGEAMPEVDWEAYKLRVSSAVRSEAEALRAGSYAQPWPRMVRWIAPMAAAAAIAFMIWWPAAHVGDPTAQGDGGSPLVVVSFDVPMTGAGVSIAYDETPREAAAGSEFIPSGSAIAIGPGEENPGDDFDTAVFF